MNEIVSLDEALQQMKEAGMEPEGFHMMFFSEDFTLTEDCPANQLLKSVGHRYGFSDTLRRQVFQMPKEKVVVTYEFACFVPFDDLKQTMEEVDSLINETFDRMVSDKTLTAHPKARVQFLISKAPEGGEHDVF